MAIMSNKEAGRAVVAHGPQARAGATWQTEKVTPFLRERTGGALALKRVAAPAEGAVEAEALPMLATAGDVREVVRLLKRKSGGITIIEGMDAIRRVFDPRKVAAYEYWGLIERRGDRLILSALGWEFARRFEPEARLFRSILGSTLAYHSALEWVFGQNLEIVTDADVARFWHEHPSQVFLSGNQKTVEGNVVCFFHLCQEAELGMATVGKRGQPTRLRVDREELAAYIAAGPAHANDDLPAQAALDESAGDNSSSSYAMADTETTPRAAAHPSVRMRVFISRRKDAPLVKQVEMALELADIECEVSQRSMSDTQLVPDETLAAMRRCDAAVIIVAKADCQAAAESDEAGALLDESVLMEIAAAVVHYNRRVILLWNEGVCVPARLRDLCRYEFAGDCLTWESGMQLLKALKNFQS
jgi:Predicted nucleotide-binding protein containing TIR-like domain